jgi:hypothetical protein
MTRLDFQMNGMIVELVVPRVEVWQIVVFEYD